MRFNTNLSRYTPSDMQERLHNQERMRILRDLALLDRSKDTLYDRLTQLASDVIAAPVSLVSMVAQDYQFFKSYTGLPEPWASDRMTPLSHSFCQHVVASNEPLIVSDAREVDFLKDNQAIPDLDVIGYLGMPLTLPDGRRLGSFCVIDSEPREWTETEIEIVRGLAAIIVLEIDLQAAANLDPSRQSKLDAARASIEKLLTAVDSEADQATFLQQLQHAREKFNLL